MKKRLIKKRAVSKSKKNEWSLPPEPLEINKAMKAVYNICESFEKGRIKNEISPTSKINKRDISRRAVERIFKSVRKEQVENLHVENEKFSGIMESIKYYYGMFKGKEITGKYGMALMSINNSRFSDFTFSGEKSGMGARFLGNSGKYCVFLNDSLFLAIADGDSALEYSSFFEDSGKNMEIKNGVNNSEFHGNSLKCARVTGRNSMKNPEFKGKSGERIEISGTKSCEYLYAFEKSLKGAKVTGFNATHKMRIYGKEACLGAEFSGRGAGKYLEEKGVSEIKIKENFRKLKFSGKDSGKNSSYWKYIMNSPDIFGASHMPRSLERPDNGGNGHGVKGRTREKQKYLKRNKKREKYLPRGGTLCSKNTNGHKTKY